MSQPDRELVLAPHHSDPPRHQPRGPLRLPPRLATTQDPRDLAVGLALQCRDVEVLNTVEVVAPGPPALDVAEWPSLGCVHGALPPSEREPATAAPGGKAPSTGFPQGSTGVGNEIGHHLAAHLSG